MKKTQLQTIREHPEDVGYISRNYCLSKYISRLGARIIDLKREGWDFETEHRNGDYIYKVIQKPEKTLFDTMR